MKLVNKTKGKKIFSIIGTSINVTVTLLHNIYLPFKRKKE